MSKDQVRIVEQYLNIDSNYAMIISGNYGTGKTHFYKSELVPMIIEVNLPKSEGKKYKAVHISLFGYSSLEEIQTAILAELYPLLKDKRVKLGAGVVKALIRGFVKIKTLGAVDVNLSDYEEDLAGQAVDWIKFDELVICFDDIDRKSPNLEIQEVLGFINSLVENQGAKIIIIANEEELLNDEKYSSKLKEKVIGVTVQYTPSAEEVYNQIIDERYENTESVFHKFLKENSEKIIKIVEANKNNFRNLVFFLEHFKTIFKPLENQFDFDSNFCVLKTEKQQAVLDFTIAVAMEYKLGDLNSTNVKDIEELNTGVRFMSIDAILGKNAEVSESEPREKSYLEKFREKYFSNIKYYYFKSILNYFLGKHSFNELALKKELEHFFVTENGIVPEHEQVLNDLGYLGCLNLSNREYRKLTYKMLTFADQGKYKLADYSIVFQFASRFNNRLNFNLPKLTQRLKKGIEKGYATYEFLPNLSFQLSIDTNIEFKNEVSEIIKFVLEINERIDDNSKKEKIKELELLFVNDFDLFVSKTTNNNEDIRYIPFFRQFDVKRFYANLEKLKGEQIWKLAHYFKRRYSEYMYSEFLVEKEFATELLTLLNLPLQKRAKNNLKNISLNYLTKSLAECRPNFDRTL